MLVESSAIETLTIKPKDPMKIFVKITDENQVCDTTIFKD